MVLPTDYTTDDEVTAEVMNEVNTGINALNDGTATEIANKLENIVEDTTPQLGGELDAQAHSIGFTLQTITSTGGAASIDWTNGNHANITLSENTTFTFTAPSNTGVMTLLVTQPATDYTITLPTTTWLGDAVTLKTGSGAVTMIVFRYDGTQYVGDWK